MKQNIRNRDNRTDKPFSRLAAENKKAVIALCLIGVMVFMWVRVLGGKTPQTAKAAVTARDTGQPNSKLKISFIELPKVKGRNDALAGDFFDADRWRGFMRDGEGGNLTGIEEVSVVSKNGSEEVIRRVAEKLKLEAIGLGKNPQAFINDKLLSAGDKLLVRDKVDVYECEVIEIRENRVFIRCGEAKITLRLTQDVEAAN
ncbi:MAG: hypothetical protein ACYSW4_06410 [Planctomycetota bacterium]|jgi:hypothetical protein